MHRVENTDKPTNLKDRIACILSQSAHAHTYQEKIGTYAEILESLREVFKDLQPKEMVVDDLKTINTAVSMLTLSIGTLVDGVRSHHSRGGLVAEYEMCMTLLSALTELGEMKDRLYAESGHFSTSVLQSRGLHG